MKSKYIALPAAVLTVLTALHPAECMSAAKEALFLCANTLIPSLFPFFVCSALIINSGAAADIGRFLQFIMKPLFNINGTGAVALTTGLLSGYPMGASATCRLYKAGCISKNEAERLLAFTNNSGPLFIIGAVGTGIFGSTRAGFVLLFSHIAAALAVGFVLRFFGTASKIEKKPLKENKNLLSAFSDSAVSCINLTAFVTFFAVLIYLLDSLGVTEFIASLMGMFGVSSGSANLLAKGIFEISTALSSAKTAYFPVVSCVLSWGGLSVLSQTMQIASDAGISVKKYIFGKLLAGGFSAFITKVMLMFVNIDTPVAIFNHPMLQKTGAFLYYLLGSLALAVSLYAIFCFLSLIVKGGREE